VQVSQRRRGDASGADLHARTSNRVQHPGRNHRDDARRHFNVDHITLGMALTVMTAQSAPAQRVPPVIYDNLLPDMGRMTQE